jgi:hypothetical protein
MKYGTRWSVLGISLSVLLVGAVTRADAQSNTVYACVNNSSGTVKIVPAGTVCPINETLQTWNIVGPQGPAGATGGTGATGATGPQGPAGAPTLTIGASNGVVQITGVKINGGTNQEQVAPGANFTVTFNYTIDGSACPGCIDQIEVGLAHAAPTACAYDAIPGVTPDSGSATVTLTAPSTPGTYYVAFDRSQHFTCAQALAVGNWWNFAAPAPVTNYIGGISVY